MTDIALGAYVPPHNIEAEQSTLGAMLISKSAVEIARGILTAEVFYRETHQILFDVICYLADRSKPVDLITVQEELKNRDKLDHIGGMSYLTSLFDTVPEASSCAHYAKIVSDKATLRNIIGASMEVIALARGQVDDITEVVDRAQSLFMGIGQATQSGEDLEPFGPILHEILDDGERAAEARMEGRPFATGLLTGIGDFDRATAGLQDTDLIIVAARPSMGKTSLCLSFAEHFALKVHKPVAIFSLEMSKKQLGIRMACSHAEINSMALKAGLLSAEEWMRISELGEQITQHPYIRICDQTDMTPSGIRSRCRRMQHQIGLGAIIVDYLQLMRADKKTESRVQEIGEIARGLKNLGREFKVPVIALSQLSRAVEQRENKRPMLSDLRESGSIEAEADMVCFLYRDAYYQKKSLEDQRLGVQNYDVDGLIPQMEVTELLISKFRSGPTGVVKVGFIPQFAKFLDWEDEISKPGPTGF